MVIRFGISIDFFFHYIVTDYPDMISNLISLIQDNFRVFGNYTLIKPYSNEEQKITFLSTLPIFVHILILIKLQFLGQSY